MGQFFHRTTFALSVVLMSIGLSSGTKITLDHLDDLVYPFGFDHLEKWTYYNTFEDLIGVNAPLINETAKNVGIWKYESLGEEGCCGGLWELRIDGYPSTWAPEDHVEFLIRFYSNLPIAITTTGTSGDIVDTVVTLDPPQDSAIQWTTYIFKLPAPAALVRFSCDFEYNPIGYLLLDKIVVGVNESVLLP